MTTSDSAPAGPIDLINDVIPPAVAGFFGGVAVTVGVTVVGFVTGLLPPGQSDLRNPCRTVDIAKLVPDVPRHYGTGGRTRAHCETITPLSATPRFSEMAIEVVREGPIGRARADHQRGCEALAGVGRVSRAAGVADEACTVIEDGRLRVATVLARRGNVRIVVRYATQATNAPATQAVAVTAARRIAERPY